MLSYTDGRSYKPRAPTGTSGSPTTSPRSKRNASPSRSQAQSRQNTSRSITEDEEDDNLVSRYAQLKQRNLAIASRPGSSLGPGIITTPPQPNGATLKDTSVNIASAFHQAANTYMPTNGSSSSYQRTNYPRSTSVEYEQQSQSSSHRRLAVPPSRSGRSSKPSSRAGASSRGSDVENEHVEVDANGRGKSPFEHITDFAKRTLVPTTFLMREPADAGEGQAPSRQATDATLVAQSSNVGESYAEEEEEFQQLQRAAKKPTSTAHKRGRISVDNKAYKPSASDAESESDEDFGDERKGRKRRSKKKDVGGGPLTTLPVAPYDKRKKKKGRSGKGGDEDEDFVSEEQGEEQVRCFLL